MTTRNLFGKKKPAFFENATSASNDIESNKYAVITSEEEETFLPHIDFSTASNFVKFGSAELYYENSIKRIYQQYPYDGSLKEKTQFQLSSSYLDRWLYANKYPKTTGYIIHGITKNPNAAVQRYGNINSDEEYISIHGGMQTASAGMEGVPLSKVFDDANKYDLAKGRTKNLRLNFASGSTVEFWLKKAAFKSSYEREIIFDAWNGVASSSAQYGRLTIELDGTKTNSPFLVTVQSGTTGIFQTQIGSTALSPSSLTSWQHYALTFQNSGSDFHTRLYVNGVENDLETSSGVNLNEITGNINAYIGALKTAPSGNTYHGQTMTGHGKLSASMDEFRYWKTRRTSRQINLNWYHPVGGGSNTDDSTTDLTVYYKFNEGITGTSSTDSTVLDYSGRIANGTWTGYPGSAARNTGSAMVSASAIVKEPHDPVIYSTHPDVVSLNSEMQNSGSLYDNENSSYLYNTIPAWIRDDDEQGDENIRKLYQIISSHFDTIYAQITALPNLKDKKHTAIDDTSSSFKPYSFSDKLLSNYGFKTEPLFSNSSEFEKFTSRDTNTTTFDLNLADIKNMVYENVYNNLEFIYKSKGTTKSIRNLIRCFGIDDELVKLNAYSDGGKYYFRDNVSHTSYKTKYLNLNKPDYFEATVYNTSSTNHAITFISGSEANNEIYSAFTMEADIIVPFKKKPGQTGYFNTPFTTSSIFGFHRADKSDAADYTWHGTDYNLKAYLIRDKIESEDAYFKLTGSLNGLEVDLTSSYYKKIFNNERWNLAVRLKPTQYPFAGGLNLAASDITYQLEFYGVNYAVDVIQSEFLLTQSVANAKGSGAITAAKRIYAGAHKTNFTGSTVDKSDLKIGGVRFWLDYIEDSTIQKHALDYKSYGNTNLYRNGTIFNNSLSGTHIPEADLLALDWRFEETTGSDGSGNFIIDDFSSGSTDTKYGWVDKITRREHRAKGQGFGDTKTDFVSTEFIFASKKQLPENALTNDSIFIKGDAEIFFPDDDEVSDRFYNLEKSMYQVVSEEMLRNFGSMSEFNNLIGQAHERYRFNYKKLDHLKKLFFEKVETDLDFDRFIEYYKWIDASMSSMVAQLIPAASRFNQGIMNVVESHILERNKYQNKFPLTTRHESTEVPIRGVGELNYNWKVGHAPLGMVKATATIVISDAGGIQHGDTFALVDFNGLSTTYTINGGVASASGGGSGGTATVGFLGVGGGVSGKVLGAAAIAEAINNTTDAGYTAVSNGVDTVTITQDAFGEEGNRTNNDSIGHTTVNNFTGGVGKKSNNCLWHKERKERGSGNPSTDRESLRQVIISEHSTSAPSLSKTDATAYSGSTYAIRRFSKPYRLSVDMKSTLHTGINYSENKDPDFLYNAVHLHGPIQNSVPANIVGVGLGTGSGLNDFADCADEVVVNTTEEYFLNNKRKWSYTAESQRHDSEEYLQKLKGNFVAPLNLMSGTVTTGYNKEFHDNGFTGVVATNLHSDVYTRTSDMGIQGPFTNAWVGGHAHRHVNINRYDSSLTNTNLIDGVSNRPEAWKLFVHQSSQLSNPLGVDPDQAFGFVGPDYFDISNPYPNPKVPHAVWYREEKAKRPLNIKNIKTELPTVDSEGNVSFTGSYVYGNYTHNYQVVQTVGRTANNILLRRVGGSKDVDKAAYNLLPTAVLSSLPQTTHPVSLLSTVPGSTRPPVFLGGPNTTAHPGAKKSGRRYDTAPAPSPLSNTHVDYVNEIQDRQLNSPADSGYTGSDSVFVSRFSAPGGPEVNSYSYLDAFAGEYSVYNCLPWRNYEVRHDSSGESTSMRVNDHLGERRGLRKLETNHCGKFGLDLEFGAPGHVHFTGENSYIDIGAGHPSFHLANYLITANKKMSFSAWFRPTTLNSTSGHTLFGMGTTSNGVIIRVNDLGEIKFSTTWSSTGYEWKSAGSLVSVNRWYHLVITYDAISYSNNPVFYVNGNQITLSTVPSVPSSATWGGIPYSLGVSDTSRIGAMGSGLQFDYYGDIAESAIWYRNLSSSDVTKIYEAGKQKSLTNTGTESEMIVWYRMGENLDCNKQIHDASGNGCHGEGYLISLSFEDSTKPSHHKIHRNVGRKVIEFDAAPDVTGLKFNYDHDNGNITHPIPRSDFQYSWINSALQYSHGVESGQQSIFGHARRDGFRRAKTAFSYNTKSLKNGIFFPQNYQNYSWNSASRTIAGWYKFVLNINTLTDISFFTDNKQGGAIWRTYIDIRPAVGADYIVTIPYDTGGHKEYKVSNVHNTLSTLTWTHIAVTHDGTTSSEPRIYFNSELQTIDTITSVGDVTGDIDTTSTGYRPIFDDSALDVYFDEINVWEVSLSSDRISELYNNGEPVLFHSPTFKTDGLVSWWRLGDSVDQFGENYTQQDEVSTSNFSIYDRFGTTHLKANQTGPTIETDSHGSKTLLKNKYEAAINFPTASTIVGV